ncbi:MULTISPECIES: protein phosphatase CheZ [Azospirillaceae]|uniref:protein phosphatase CheZ n=1 Tax=Azospirillaceae TaxID=2829815 RepID=UPI000B71DEDC|nr:MULTISPECIES: protein phosphatase CheZ [Azospirillaceae]MDG5494381.1 protein phosphatase CheZ [Niveispirillum sp. BGYR6]SNR95946.1 chemotaxis protein CheZ [Azospirillum sp. RU38E]SNS12607.1 chemotaxis protein CheZ [Azospirillum sp. RU37A]
MVQLRHRPFMAEIQRAKRNGQAEPPASNGTQPAALPPPINVELDNGEVLAAISALGNKLDRFLSVDHTQIEKIQIDIADIAGRIQATKVEMAALRHPLSKEDKFQEASEQLGAVVRATEEATNQIMASTEEIEDIVNEVRAQLPDGYQSSRLKDLNDLTLRIFEACNFQDLTGQRITKVVQALAFIEQRIEGMISVWNQKELEALPMPPNLARQDAGLDLHGPAGEKEKVSQADIDALFD